MQTERIQLPDGAWWDIRKVMHRGMEKAVTRAALSHLPALPRNGSNLATAETLADELLRNMRNVDMSAIEDAYLLHGTVAYSYGDRVDQETIDGIDAAITRRVLERMYELYNPQRLTEGQRQDFFVKPSNVTSVSPGQDSPQS